VQTYGGGLWHTWFDRDLSVAGRVIVKTDAGFSTRLVKVARPICRISNVAIHLTSGAEREAFAVNKETHLAPILATAAADELNAPVRTASAKVGAAGGPDAGDMHHSALLEVLAQELGILPGQIVDLELALYDTQPCAVGGVYNEFIFAPRLDNLGSCFGGLSAITALSGDNAVVADASHVFAIALFDHEEVGSQSGAGAGGTLMSTIISALNEGDDLSVRRCVRQSLMISADMAHSVHPNYAHKHEENHRPVINAGCVVKHNTNQRYATNLVTTHMFKQFAVEAGVPLQHFVVRQDMGCGTTIGPIMAAALGMPTVDVGIPQLSMHSIRETCGVSDMAASVKLFKFALRSQPAVYAALEGHDNINE
jgi:aspartyl aminopeptidase